MDDDTDLAGGQLGEGEGEESSALMSLLSQQLLHHFLKTCHKIPHLPLCEAHFGNNNDE